MDCKWNGTKVVNLCKIADSNTEKVIIPIQHKLHILQLTAKTVWHALEGRESYCSKEQLHLHIAC